MHISKSAAVLSVLPLSLLSACGTPSNTTSTTVHNAISSTQQSSNQTNKSIGNNPPFEVRVKQEIAPLDPNFDPISVNSPKVSVFSWNGTRKQLNVSQTPLLFVAYWCPHCQRTLKMLQSHFSTIHNPPAIVASGYAADTTLVQAKKLYLEEESALDLSFPKSKVYFLLNTTENSQLVQAYPELYFSKNHTTETLLGEHKFNVWKEALS